MINLIEQSQSLTFLLCSKQQSSPHTTFPLCEQYYLANPNETPQTSTRGYNTPSWTKHMVWNSSGAHVDNQTTFLLGAPTPRLLAAFDTTSCKWVSNVNSSLRLPKEFADSSSQPQQHQESNLDVPFTTYYWCRIYKVFIIVVKGQY